jgi:hypothetical protein
MFIRWVHSPAGVIMSKAQSELSTKEMQEWMDLRLDEAAEEIGYATGMMVMSLLANLPTAHDPEAHIKAFPGLQRFTDVLENRFARMAADGFAEAVRFRLPVVRHKPQQDQHVHTPPPLPTL